MTIDKLSWMTVYPELVLLVMACVIAMIDLGVTSPRRTLTYVLTLLTLGVVAVMQAPVRGRRHDDLRFRQHGRERPHGQLAQVLRHAWR